MQIQHIESKRIVIDNEDVGMGSVYNIRKECLVMVVCSEC